MIQNSENNGGIELSREFDGSDSIIAAMRRADPGNNLC
jgi:hypothetical protein